MVIIIRNRMIPAGKTINSDDCNALAAVCRMQEQTIVTLIMQYKITELFSQTAFRPCFPPSEQ